MRGAGVEANAGRWSGAGGGRRAVLLVPPTCWRWSCRRVGAGHGVVVFARCDAAMRVCQRALRLSRYWRADVQEIEGVNNMVQLACKVAPGISLALLDAGVALRKNFGYGSRASKVYTWSVKCRVSELAGESAN
eukprot:359359-Alexandrium_andersonii.AAC.1